jgi:serine/threonine protein kinase
MSTIKSTSPTSADKTFGKYRELSLLGQGGFGCVYRAFDPELERYIAIKILDRQHQLSPELKTAFFREIKLQAQLNLPGMIRVFESGETDKQLFYTMELINGLPLDKYCYSKQLNCREKLALIAEVAEIVAELHQRDIIHRDIKPSNVMVDEHGQVKLLDLGVAISIREQAMFQGQFCISGSPGYIAPELFTSENNQPTVAVDTYALGIMTYELLCGQLPFDIEFLSMEEIGAVITEESPRPMITTSNDSIPRSIEPLIRRTIGVDPSSRPSATTFANTLKKAITKSPSMLRYAALLGGIGIAGVIIAGVLYQAKIQNDSKNSSTITVRSEKNVPKAKEESKQLNKPKATIQTTKLKPSAIAQRGQLMFFTNSTPALLKAKWESAKNELLANPSMKGKGALVFYLRSNSILTIKNADKKLETIDAKFQHSGILYEPENRIFTLELRRKAWDKPIIKIWHPQATKVDCYFQK